LAAGYSEGPFRPFYERLNKDPNWETYKIESDHHIMLNKPHELVEILEEIVSKDSRGQGFEGSRGKPE
jgi:hypothetical protein